MCEMLKERMNGGVRFFFFFRTQYSKVLNAGCHHDAWNDDPSGIVYREYLSVYGITVRVFRSLGPFPAVQHVYYVLVKRPGGRNVCDMFGL